MNENTLKTIILAAGPGYRDGTPYLKVLETLDQRRIIDYVLDCARRVTDPADTIIVVGYERGQVQDHLGPAYCYVQQEPLLGTGHAVIQAVPELQDHAGDVLILYGDTPLIRPGTIQGMITRHRLRRAELTLLSAIVDAPLPYGRIIRDAQERIIDIIEEEEIAGRYRDIKELNIGAYVVKAGALLPALGRLEERAEGGGRIRLTDIIHQLIRAGQRVESYQIYDSGEILGINSDEDLRQAEFILQKRYLRPLRAQEENLIQFGTGGWRAIIGEAFTFGNVRRLSQALANLVVREEREQQGVMIGYDRRFLSDRAAHAAAEVFAGNNVPVQLFEEAASTPVITYATAAQNTALGLAFTASHNPPEWNGLKVFRSDGSLLLADETSAIEAEANAIASREVVKIDLDLGLEAGVIRMVDLTNGYIDLVESFVDLGAMREAGLRVLVDPMFGVGQFTLGTILTEARCRVNMIHDRHDPLFGGQSPTPDLKALSNLIRLIKEGGYDIGLAMDGDADRIALIDETGEYIHVNDILLLLYYYLHESKKQRGGVVRNLATTHLLDRLARHFGEDYHEVPVGFKHVWAAMEANNCLLGGESSGGLTIRGHIKGKDGILAAVLIVEMLARTGKTVSQLRQQVYAITGRLYGIEDNAPATPEMKIIVPRHLAEKPVTAICGCPVLDTLETDGTKFLMENDNWLLIRFSGTEPVLRIFAEATTPELAQQFVDWAKGLTMTGA